MMEEKMSKTPRNLQALITFLTDKVGDFDDKMQKVMLKWLEKLEKDAMAIAKAAKLNVWSFQDIDKAEKALWDEDEGEPGENKDEGKEPSEPGKEPSAPADEGKETDGTADEAGFGKVKQIFGKFKPEEKDYFKKRREFSKNPAYGKVKDHLDKMKDGDFNKLFEWNDGNSSNQPAQPAPVPAGAGA